MVVQLIKLVSETLSVPYDQIVLISSLFSSIPIGLINYLIKDPTIRLLYGGITGFFLMFSLYGSGIIHVIIGTFITYFFMKYFGRKKSAFYVFIITFLYLSSLHIHRMIFYYGIWTADDITSLFMVTIPKYSSMAFSYEDGDKDDKDLKNNHWKNYKIKDMPTLLETLSYIFYFPSCVIGPVFEFRDFKDFIYHQGVYKNLKLKTTFFFGGIELIFTFMSMAYYAYFSSKIPLSYAGSVEFGEKSLLYKFLYINFAMSVHRSKFYSGWLLCCSGMIFCGLSYTEHKKEEGKKIELPLLYLDKGDYYITYEKGGYGSIFDCEFGINPKTKITSWNHSTHLWLKYFLFLRLINVENKIFKNNYSLASLITFMISAFWHGFYYTYYIFFFLFFIYQNANEKIDKLGLYTYLRSDPKLFLLKTPFWIFNQFMCNALGTIIFNLRWELFVQFLKNTYYSPIILVFLLYLGTMNIKGEKSKSKIKQKESETKKLN